MSSKGKPVSSKKAPTRGASASVGSDDRLGLLRKFLKEGGYTTDEVCKVLPLKNPARETVKVPSATSSVSNDSEEKPKGPSGVTRRTALRKARKALRDAFSGDTPSESARKDLERICYLQDSTSLKDLTKATSEEFCQLLESNDWIKEQLQDISLEELRKRNPHD